MILLLAFSTFPTKNAHSRYEEESNKGKTPISVFITHCVTAFDYDTMYLTLNASTNSVFR